MNSNHRFSFSASRRFLNRLASALGVFAASSLAVTAVELAAPAYDYPAPTPGTYTLPVIKMAGDGNVLDAAGRERRLRDLTRGRVTLLSFIYTRCAAARACPHATGVLREIHRVSAVEASLAQTLRLVSLSFDPGNDTPARMADYSAQAGDRSSGAPWHFLTTASPAELAPILDRYDQAVARRANPRDPAGPLNHTLRVFLIDTAGQVRNIYSADTLDPRLVLGDARTLLMETRRPESTGVLTPAQAVGRTGETCTVSFKVETAARVADLTERGVPHPLEVLLLDAPNGDEPVTPHERATIVVSVPGSALGAFGAQTLDDLARRFEGRTVAVTGRIEAEPHPLRSNSEGGRQPRVRITVTEPGRIRLTDGI